LRSYRVYLSETAKRQLQGLPVRTQTRIKRALAKLEGDPFHPRPKAAVKRLRGPIRDYYRQRIGEYRALYVVEGNRVLVAKILPRSKAYHWLE
jgi:mRNA interferase RelE/StbE